MRPVLASCALATVAMFAGPSVGRAQITAGQTDTFQSGTVLGWQQGAGAPGPTLQDGGPAGAGDFYMQVTATGGFGAGSRLTVFNQAQWKGDYIAAGVNAIEMDVRAPATNSGSLSYRIAFRNAGGIGYVSTTPFTVPADGVWRKATFAVTPEAMTAVNAPAPFNDFMTNPGELRLIHGNNISLNGDAFAGAVGVDNIKALGAPIPEPTGGLAAAAVVALGWAVRRATQRTRC